MNDSASNSLALQPQARPNPLATITITWSVFVCGVVAVVVVAAVVIVVAAAVVVADVALDVDVVVAVFLLYFVLFLDPTPGLILPEG